MKIKKVGIGVMCMVFLMGSTGVFLKKSEIKISSEVMEVKMRKIAHRVLLDAQDSTTRILPIIKTLWTNTYILQFEKDVFFKPETLVHSIQEEISKEGLPKNYFVSVLDCNSESILYAYIIEHNSVPNEIHCRKREYKKGCYQISIAFENKEASTASVFGNYLLFLSGGAIFIYGIFFIFQKRKTPVIPNEALGRSVSIGNTFFYPEKKILTYQKKTISLTDKEVKVLTIFSENINSLIDRNFLLKVGWEDEGVFTGRSLDVFVSRLRKKLELDSSVKIINVHGKGYKLEIE